MSWIDPPPIYLSHGLVNKTDRLIINFRYHPYTVSLMKQMRARWSPKRKIWHMAFHPGNIHRIKHKCPNQVFILDEIEEAFEKRKNQKKKIKTPENLSAQDLLLLNKVIRNFKNYLSRRKLSEHLIEFYIDVILDPLKHSFAEKQRIELDPENLDMKQLSKVSEPEDGSAYEALDLFHEFWDSLGCKT